jgi:competence protein ComEC
MRELKAFIIFIFFIFFPNQAESTALLKVYFLNVGYGDAIILQIPEGKMVLVDGGKPEDGKKVAAALKKLKIDNLDLVIITHFHKDHAGGLQEILSHFLKSVSQDLSRNRVLIPFIPNSVEPEVAPVKTQILTLPYRIIRRGETLSLSSKVDLNILHPKVLTDDPNEDSIVAKVSYGDTSILLTADIGPATQMDLVHAYGAQMASDIIKIPHHGSVLLEEFIEAVRPQSAVISVGPNPYGSPKPQVLELLKKKGIQIYRTDQVGDISVLSDGQSLRILNGIHP